MKFYRTFTFVALIAALCVGGFFGYQFGKSVYTAAGQGGAAYQYLSQEIAKDDKGKPVNRAAIIDAIIKQALDAAKATPQAPVK